MPARVTATPEALELIERLRASHGPLAFFQSGGCCEGSAPMCLSAGDLSPAPSDVQLVEIGGAPFYIDAEQYERWRRPAFVVDVSPGPAEGFSLDALTDRHFVARTAGHAAARSDRR